MPPIIKDSDTEFLLGHLLGPMQSIRARRRYIEDEWLRNYAAWQGWPSVSQLIPLPNGAVRYFIPHARRSIEKIVARSLKLVMPQSKWFQVHPMDDIGHSNAQKVDATLRYIVGKKYKSKRVYGAATRALALYNFSVLSTSVQIQDDEVWPYQRAVDPYMFYIFPETALDINETLLLFEDCIIPFEQYASFTNPMDPNKGLALPLDPEHLHDPEWPYHLVERLSYRGLTNPNDFSLGSDDSGYMLEQDFADRKSKIQETLKKRSRAFVYLSKMYFRMDSRWFLAWIVHNTLEHGKHSPEIVRLDTVEGNPSYQWANSRPIPGEMYTNSIMDDIRNLQILANNQISSAEANRAIVSEPPIAFTGNQRTESWVYRPRGIWRVQEGDTPLDKQMMPIPIQNTTDVGLKMYQVSLGQMEAMAGGGTMAEGQPGRNMPRAGFAVDNLMDMAMADIKDLADTVEQELLTPGLADTYAVLMKYVPKDQIFKIPGIGGQTPEIYNYLDLKGDYSFNWVGSIQAQHQMERADKLFSFFQVASQPQVMQQLAAEGKKLALRELLTEIWTNGLSERNLDQVIVQMSQEEIENLKQQQQAAQQQQPNPQEVAKQLDLKNKHADLKNQHEVLKNKATELDNQGKVVELKTKMVELHNKQMEPTIKHHQFQQQQAMEHQRSQQQQQQAVNKPQGNNNNGAR